MPIPNVGSFDITTVLLHTQFTVLQCDCHFDPVCGTSYSLLAILFTLSCYTLIAFLIKILLVFVCDEKIKYCWYLYVT